MAFVYSQKFFKYYKFCILFNCFKKNVSPKWNSNSSKWKVSSCHIDISYRDLIDEVNIYLRKQILKQLGEEITSRFESRITALS
jgi:hypothetical protein